MHAIYLKGLSTTLEDFEYISAKFEDEGIYLTLLECDYSKLYGMNKEEIFEYLRKRLPMDSELNLVCHSIGCHFGVLLANNMENIKNIALVSPEFDQATKEEMKAVIPSSNESYYVSNKKDFSFKDFIKDIKSKIVFLKSNRWINEETNKFLRKNINTIMIYSKGDKYISRPSLYTMARKSNIRLEEIDSNSHNPILEDTPCISLIKEEFSKNILSLK